MALKGKTSLWHHHTLALNSSLSPHCGSRRTASKGHTPSLRRFPVEISKFLPVFGAFLVSPCLVVV